MGLHKTREGALSTLKDVLSKSSKIDDELFDRLEEIFIMADIGVDTVIDFIDQLKQEVLHQKITDPLDLQELIIDKMFEIYLKGEIVNANLNLCATRAVVAFVFCHCTAAIVSLQTVGTVPIETMPAKGFHSKEWIAVGLCTHAVGFGLKK